MTLPTTTETHDMTIAEKFNTVKNVVTPVLSLQIDKPVYVRFLTECYDGDQIEVDKDPATLAMVLDMETMEDHVLVVSFLIHQSLLDQYDDGEYVGKYFKITKLAKRAGKKYNDYRLVEITPRLSDV